MDRIGTGSATQVQKGATGGEIHHGYQPRRQLHGQVEHAHEKRLALLVTLFAYGLPDRLAAGHGFGQPRPGWHQVVVMLNDESQVMLGPGAQVGSAGGGVAVAEFLLDQQSHGRRRIQQPAYGILGPIDLSGQCLDVLASVADTREDIQRHHRVQHAGRPITAGSLQDALQCPGFIIHIGSFQG